MTCFSIREPSFKALEDAPIYFRYGANKRRVLVDKLTADAIIAVHGALNEHNQAKFERMVAASPIQLRKVADFCWKHVSIGSAA